MKPNRHEIGRLETGGHPIALQLVRSKRRKRTIAFALESATTLLITAPIRSSVESIRKIIETRTEWILRRLAQRPTRYANTHQFVTGGTFPYLGHNYRLGITQDPHRPQGCELHPHRLNVNLHDTSLSGAHLEQEVRLEIMLWLKRRAKIKIQKRMDFWAHKMGVRYDRLMLSNPQRRWGSCSARNIIRINWRLIMAPLPLLDYVVVHELGHVTHKHHRKTFWQSLELTLPDVQVRRARLRQLESQLTF